MKIDEKEKKKWPWKSTGWNRRARAIAKMIKPNDSVIDIGGGMGGLRRLIPDNIYTTIDRIAWTDETVVADFNKGEFPEMGLFGVIVCQGVIEYMDDPLAFLEGIKKYGRKMIASYYDGDNNVDDRKNQLTFRELEKIIKKSGWGITERIDRTPTERLYVCIKS